jgi:hypothetical protein
MKSRNPNLDWMRKILADLESSRADPQIAALMAGLTEPGAETMRDIETAPDGFGGVASNPLKQSMPVSSAALPRK